MGTKLGGKPPGKKPFKAYDNTGGKPWKGGNGGNKDYKPAFSKAGPGQQKRKMPFKAKNEEEGEGEETSTF